MPSLRTSPSSVKKVELIPEQSFHEVLCSMRVLPVSRWQKLKERMGFGVYRLTSDITFEKLMRLYSTSAVHRETAQTLAVDARYPLSVQQALQQVINTWHAGVAAKLEQESPSSSPHYSLTLSQTKRADKGGY